MLLNSSTGDVILVRKTEPPEKVSEIQFSPGKHLANMPIKGTVFLFYAFVDMLVFVICLLA